MRRRRLEAIAWSIGWMVCWKIDGIWMVVRGRIWRRVVWKVER